MKPESKKKWVKALLSQQYPQGEGELFNGVGYCCLGVYGHAVLGKSNDELMGRRFLRKSPFNLTEYAFLPGWLQRELADLNDEGVPFDMIAGLIDQAL